MWPAVPALPDSLFFVVGEIVIEKDILGQKIRFKLREEKKQSTKGKKNVYFIHWKCSEFNTIDGERAGMKYTKEISLSKAHLPEDQLGNPWQ